MATSEGKGTQQEDECTSRKKVRGTKRYILDMMKVFGCFFTKQQHRHALRGQHGHCGVGNEFHGRHCFGDCACLNKFFGSDASENHCFHGRVLFNWQCSRNYQRRETRVELVAANGVESYMRVRCATTSIRRDALHQCRDSVRQVVKWCSMIPSVDLTWRTRPQS